MERQFIHSTLINTVGYDPEHCILELEFEDGHITQYLNVTPEKYSKFMSATSHGRYFINNIRPKHKSKKIQSRTSQSHL